MSQLAIGTVVGGKLKYFTRNDNEKKSLQQTAQFVKDHEGRTIYIELHDEDEMDFQKNLSMYFEKILLPPLFVAMKDEYCLEDINECRAVLSVMFAKKKKSKKDATPYEIPLRISEMSQISKSDFIAKVANFATKFGIKFPSANEINKATI